MPFDLLLDLLRLAGKWKYFNLIFFIAHGVRLYASGPAIINATEYTNAIGRFSRRRNVDQECS